MKKTIMAALVVIAATFAAHAADFLGTFKQAPRGASNQPGYWGEGAWKIEASGNSLGKCYVADDYYDIVVLKSGTKDDVWVNVQPGDQLCTSDRKDISHIILVPGDDIVIE